MLIVRWDPRSLALQIVRWDPRSLPLQIVRVGPTCVSLAYSQVGPTFRSLANSQVGPTFAPLANNQMGPMLSPLANTPNGVRCKSSCMVSCCKRNSLQQVRKNLLHGCSCKYLVVARKLVARAELQGYFLATSIFGLVASVFPCNKPFSLPCKKLRF